MNYFPGLASNHDPPDLCLLSSEEYRRETLAPALFFFILGETLTSRTVLPDLSTLLQQWFLHTLSEEQQAKSKTLEQSSSCSLTYKFSSTAGLECRWPSLKMCCVTMLVWHNLQRLVNLETRDHMSQSELKAQA
jgi:hypothetical protein